MSRDTAGARDLLTDATARMAADVAAGLSGEPKTLPCKYLYDARGSALFERIGELEEYYPTRTETAILQAHADAMARAVGTGVLLVEYGSGSSAKTRILLDRLHDPAGYVPIDISRKHLLATARALRADYPHLEVLPVVADFTAAIRLPRPTRRPRRTVGFFPGSTIGNFAPPAARRFLHRIAESVGPGGGLLIGADLQKPAAILEAAYDDAEGVTAAFNRNLLVRINRELDGDLDVAAFRHRAVWNAEAGRVEMSLVSTRAQEATVDGAPYRFAAGEAIVTEYAHKYTLAGFAALAAAAGFDVERVWADPSAWFSVQMLRARD